MGLLNLRLLPQLIQEKGFLPHLDVVAEEECNRELKKDEEIGNQSKSFFSDPQTPDAESGVAEDENINVVLIHKEAFVPFLRSPVVARVHGAGSERPLPLKIESKNRILCRLKG